jgi:hypothetical protein
MRRSAHWRCRRLQDLRSNHHGGLWTRSQPSQKWKNIADPSLDKAMLQDALREKVSTIVSTRSLRPVAACG